MFSLSCTKRNLKRAEIPILSFLCTCSFRFFFYSEPNLIWVILFFLLFLFFQRFYAEKALKPVKIASAILSILYSILIALDHELRVNGLFTFSLRTAACSVGMAVFFFYSLSWLLSVLLRKPTFTSFKSGNSRACLLPLAGFILLFWLPYLLASFPGNVNSDAICEIRQQIGLSPLSNHHPIIHQFLIRICLSIDSLFGGLEAGVAVYSILQMAVMAILFALCICFLAENGASIGIQICAFLFYALYPINGFYSVTMYKDVPFAGAVLLIMILLIRELREEKSSVKNRGRIISLILLFFFFCTVRNNGYYAFLVGFPLLMLCCSRQAKRLLIIFLSVLLLVAGYRYVIFDVAGAARSASGEALSLPLQMLARVVSMDNPDLEESDFQILGEVIPDYSILANNYIPDNSDPIKDPRVFLSGSFSASPFKYMKSWIRIGLHYPRTYLDAFLLHTRGYWSPNIRSSTITAEIYQPNGLNLTQNTIFAPLRYSLISLYDSISLMSVLSVFFSMGFFVILYLFSAALLALKKQFPVLYPMLICFALWLTVIAGPITAFHYFYALATALPLFLGLAISLRPRGV